VAVKVATLCVVAVKALEKVKVLLTVRARVAVDSP